MVITGVRGKEHSWKVKTANFPFKGNKKELFDAKPKVDDVGDMPFTMRTRRCGRRPPACFPSTADDD